MRIVIAGLSITSSWGNGHATTYRGLVRALASRGHDVLFLERDMPWYASHRDLAMPPCGLQLYESTAALEAAHGGAIRAADLVILGSYVPDGVAVADFVLRTARGCTAFYDIDTPVTLAALRRGAAEYIERRQIGRFDLYLSFTGGPTLERLETEFGARRARAFYCSVDPELYRPDPAATQEYELGYLGTYSPDRQPALEALLLDAAAARPHGRFVIAGPLYPDTMKLSPNVARIDHLPPPGHRGFYNRLRFTLNVTRRDMIEAGYSPSVRLFEAAACGVPVISDVWPGLETVLTPGREILLARRTPDVLEYLADLPEAERREIGRRAQARVLESHTPDHRVLELERHVAEAAGHVPAESRSA